MIINPDNDGIDHINTYSKGKTELGKLLTNFAHTPFVHPKYGEFQSVEGFWYFKKTGYSHSWRTCGRSVNDLPCGSCLQPGSGSLQQVKRTYSQTDV